VKECLVAVADILCPNNSNKTTKEIAQSCRERLNACRGKHTLMILSEDGTLGVQEGDGDNNSFSQGTGQRTQSLNGKKKKKIILTTHKSLQ
jgi:hypothetical protein